MSESVLFSCKVSKNGGSSKITVPPHIIDFKKIDDGDILEFELKAVHKNANGGENIENQNCDP